MFLKNSDAATGPTLVAGVAHVTPEDAEHCVVCGGQPRVLACGQDGAEAAFSLQSRGSVSFLPIHCALVFHNGVACPFL